MGLCLFMPQEPWVEGALELPSDPIDLAAFPAPIPTEGPSYAWPRLPPGGQTVKDSDLLTGKVSVVLAGL